MSINPVIELVTDKFTGRLIDCYALNDAGERAVKINISGAREHYNVAAAGIVSIDVDNFRVRKTEK